jgi:RNA polymerase sigma factor (TIGR02999 family)
METGSVTMLLQKAADGDRHAADLLFPALYEELRSLADRHLRRERRDHTLQTTALVNEAYLKMIGDERTRWQNRTHFFALASQAMRRILVNHATRRGRQKRGGGQGRIQLEEGAAMDLERDLDLVALDEALKELAKLDERKSRIVELRFFGGMNIEETAEALHCAPATVKRDWTFAKTWLLREVSKGSEDDSGTLPQGG